MENLTLYTNPWSRGRVVRWMLEEVGAKYDVQVMEYGGNIKSPDYLAINPMGKVPTLVHGRTVITEVAAICAYLADQYPDKKLAPPTDSSARGSYYRWLFFAAGPLEMASSAKAFSWPIDDKTAQAVGCGHPESTINTLATALETGPYLCGEQFTAADVVMGSYIGWELMQKNLEPRQAFTNYVKRVESRPAAKRANELDDALVPSDKQAEQSDGDTVVAQ